MDETVARLNIRHFRSLLATERDEAKRGVLRKLLTEEEQKLAAIMQAQRRQRPSSEDEPSG